MAFSKILQNNHLELKHKIISPKICSENEGKGEKYKNYNFREKRELEHSYNLSKVRGETGD